MKTLPSLIAATTVLAVACSKPTDLPGEFVGLPHDGWEYGDVLSFNAAGDSIGDIDHIDFTVRHTNDFPYANLWIEIVYDTAFSTTPGQSVADTFDIRLADDYGKWLGSGSGPTIQSTQSIRLSRRPTSRSTFDVRHIMRVDRVEEIEQIGLTFVRPPQP